MVGLLASAAACSFCLDPPAHYILAGKAAAELEAPSQTSWRLQLYSNSPTIQGCVLGRIYVLLLCVECVAQSDPWLLFPLAVAVSNKNIYQLGFRTLNFGWIVVWAFWRGFVEMTPLMHVVKQAQLWLKTEYFCSDGVS